MIIDCLADLHGNYPDVPGGDLLIIAGDLTTNDSVRAWKNFYDWLIPLKYKKKVYIAGNHDNFLTHAVNSREAYYLGRDRGDSSMEYLCDSGCEFEGLRIWGSPWTTTFEGMNPHCMAFTGDEKLLEEKFALIPSDVDILITHSPPYGVMDKTKRGKHVGSVNLHDRILLRRPKLHIYGHIHEGYGQIELNGIKFVNASHVNEDYEPINAPVRIIL